MTFKANWEKAHTKHHLTDNLIKQMLATFYPDNELKSFDIINGGCANINIRVLLKNSDKPIILRVYLRDPNSSYKEKQIADTLKDKLPIPQVFHIAKIQGYTFAIMEYLPGKPLRDLLLNKNTPKHTIKKIMLKVGKILSIISKITFDQSGFFDKNLKITENITHNGFINFFSKALEDKKVESALSIIEINQIKTLFKTYKNFLPNESDKNLVHADFDPANILIEINNGEIKISGILDWEFSFSGSTLCDVANMLRYAHHMPEEYQNSFLEGLTIGGYQLPQFWTITASLLNLFSLLDCLKRSDPKNRPNQIHDIQELIQYIILNFKKIEQLPVEVIPYNPNWALLFEQEAKKIQSALRKSFVAIHHVGSTAVPDLAAKPKIDIIAEVNNLSFPHKNLINLHYEYRGGFNLPLRKSFTYRSKNLNVNLHIFEKDDPEVELNLLFRDHLRHNDTDKKEYEKLKFQLIKDETSHKKNNSIPNQLEKAGFIV